MNRIAKRFLYWSPRGMCIAFILFISMFALDAFDERPMWRIPLALFMHLIPSFAMVGILVLSWKWEWTGGLGFCALALLYCVAMRGRFPLSVYAAIAGPAFLVGILFFANWIWRHELRAAV